MKASMKLVLIALFALTAPLVTFAANADVMVVVNGNTEVNREAYNFVRKIFAYNGVNYTITATLDPSTVKAGQYKSVVVLNTGVATGTDPVLQKFIAGYADKKNLYLVNLYRGLNNPTVTTFAAANTSLGVDGVTASSIWRGSIGGVDPQTVHITWVKDLVKFLQRA